MPTVSRKLWISWTPNRQTFKRWGEASPQWFQILDLYHRIQHDNSLR
jgi:hypothetical protein